MPAPFKPRRRPHLHWQWGSGDNYSTTNPGGLRGDVLPTPAAAWPDVEALATRLSATTICVNYPVGFKVGENAPAATWYVWTNHYPQIANWFANNFADFKTEGREYAIYQGIMHNTLPEDQSSIDTTADVVPSPAFFVNAIAPLKELGFTFTWIDASEATAADGVARKPILAALEDAGWKTGGELWPVSFAAPPSGLLVRYPEPFERPYMVVWPNYKTFYKPNNITASQGTELHVCPRFGDSDFTIAEAQELIDRGFVISPYTGFELTRPDTFDFLCDYYAGIAAQENPAVECAEVQPITIDTYDPDSQECCEDEESSVFLIPGTVPDWSAPSGTFATLDVSQVVYRRTDGSGGGGGSSGPNVGGPPPGDITEKPEGPNEGGPPLDDTEDPPGGGVGGGNNQGPPGDDTSSSSGVTGGNNMGSGGIITLPW
jgi:hypothetical protein